MNPLRHIALLVAGSLLLAILGFLLLAWSYSSGFKEIKYRVSAPFRYAAAVAAPPVRYEASFVEFRLAAPGDERALFQLAGIGAMNCRISPELKNELQALPPGCKLVIAIKGDPPGGRLECNRLVAFERVRAVD